MKAMSKFFLIVSGVLVGIGIVICIIASVMAKSQGIQLFQKKTDGKYIYTVDLENTDITKISIDATNADITVYTGQEKEYIEFINFDDNYYSVSTTNMVVSFNEYVDLPSLFSFWDPSYSFKGMRSILKLVKHVDGPKEINIYLSDRRDMKIFDFTLESGEIIVENMSSDTDYTFSLDSGRIEMTNINTESNLKINANSCSVDIEKCSFGYFNGDIATANVKGNIGGVHSFVLSSKSGNIDLDIAFDSELSNTNIMTSGTVSVNGEFYQGTYNNISDDIEITEEFATAKITGDDLNVNFDFENKTAQTPEDTQ